MNVVVPNSSSAICTALVNDTAIFGVSQVSRMEDELEDRIFYQTYISHMKLISKFAVGLPLNSSHFSYMWRLLRIYILKPEVLILSSLLVLIVVYIQYVEVWSRSLLSKLHFTLGTTVPSKVQKLQYFVKSPGGGDFDNLSWEYNQENAAAYAIQGRRPKMEDRFVINDNIQKTGVSVYAVFDGHGGEFAADFAKDKLITNLNKKIIELKQLIASGKVEPLPEARKSVPASPSLKRTDSNRPKKTATTDDQMKSFGITDPLLLEKIVSIRGITREPAVLSAVNEPPPDIRSFIDSGSSINYGKLLTSEVLSADRLIVEQAQKSHDVAGSTALIAIMEGSKLFVANVGDSRGVMCDSKGAAIPLSFDHKPHQVRELKRIKEAGGFVAFNGVWRVAGILATSRALGDYPLKTSGLVIAEPDILTFDLADYKPRFIILASDGLWDMFSNEEAVAFVKQNFELDPQQAARQLVATAYQRGSLDNITVLIISFAEQTK